MVLSGIITAMVTPFDDQENIDYLASEQLIEHLIAKGVSGIFIFGTNGEFHLITPEEKVSFAQFVMKKIAKRVPLIVGIGGNATGEVISLAEKMSKVGVDYLSVISPYFIPLSEAELFQHYQRIAQASSIPILLYNIPKWTGNPLTVGLVERLADETNIIGIKDSSGHIENIQRYLEVTRDKDFCVLSGSDSLILPALQLGATGAVAATSNAITEHDVRIYSEFMAGNLMAAQEAQDAIEEFRRILKYGTIPCVLKHTVGLRGIHVGHPRKPVQPVAAEYWDDIQKVMQMYIQKEEEVSCRK